MDADNPKYIPVALVDGDSLIWQVRRTSDMALAGTDLGYTTNDGVKVSLPTRFGWEDYEEASDYIDRIEAGEPLAAPLVWIPEQPFFASAPPMHTDGPL